MEREQWNRLLAEYATGGLSEDEKKRLFTAALADQELFDQLMDEDEVRELIEAPGARERLIEALEERPLAAVAAMPALTPVPAAASPRLAKSASPWLAKSASPWLAWAAGIGVVFVSGAITYMMFEGTTLRELAQVRPEAPRETKPFVPPPAPAAERARPVTVEAPPPVFAEKRAPAVPPVAVNIPLPKVPPPTMPEMVPAKETAVADVGMPVRGERDQFKQAFRETSQQRAVPMPAPASRPAGMQAVGSALSTEVAKAEVAKKAAPAPSLWRRTGDGVWIRVPAGEAVGRMETLAIRFTPGRPAAVTVNDEAGARVARKQGRAGEELEFVIPAALLENAGETLTLTVVEGARPVAVTILLRQP
jgi:hypothetical protein